MTQDDFDAMQEVAAIEAEEAEMWKGYEEWLDERGGE
jgi:hypothetical protein